MSNSTNQIWIPPTTSKTVVFPFDKESKTFQKDFYEPELTGDQLSNEEVNQFLNDIEAELNKPSETNSAWTCFVISMIGLCWLDIIVTIFIWVLPDRDFKEITKGEVIHFAWMMPFVLIFLFLLCNGPPPESSGQLRKCKLREIADKYNGALESKGLKWYLPDKFPAWIELTKHMDKKNNETDDFETVGQQVPKTTEFTIIFPAKRKKNSLSLICQFNQDLYSPDMVNGRVSSQEMRVFLAEINNFFRTPIKRTSIEERSWKICCCLGLWLQIELFGLCHFDNHFPEILTTFHYIMGVYSFLACILLFFYFANSAIKRREMQRKNGCQEILDEQNRTLQGRGLRWCLPKEFPDWIELCKDEDNHNFIRPQSEREPENDIEEGNQDSSQGYQKKFKDQMYVPLLEDEREREKKKNL